MGKVRAHGWMSGRVQGVFFRAGTKQKAEELGLAGWVKNLDDGRVEAVFEGEEKKVKEMLKWCKEGNQRAEVDQVEVEWEEMEGLTGFEIVR